jgi:hypothetical protein
MTYFVYAAPISITTACFSVKPIPSYNGIFKTSLQHDPRQSLHTKRNEFQVSMQRALYLGTHLDNIQCDGLQLRKNETNIEIKLHGRNYFKVTPKSANHVSTLHERNNQLCKTISNTANSNIVHDIQRCTNVSISGPSLHGSELQCPSVQSIAI